MKNKKIKVSIVTKTHNHAQLLKRLLDKISLQKRLKDFEILIIDSSSKDNTKKIARENDCRIVNIDPKEFSHAYTFNLGAEKAKGEIVLFASVDVIPKNDLWAFHLIKHFKDKKVAGVFGKQEPIKNFGSIEEFKIKKMFPDNSKECLPFFSGSDGAIRKSVWKKVKFPENLPYRYIGGEDQKWAKEAEKKGYKIVYEPLSIVEHSHKYSFKTRVHHARMGGKNKDKIEEWNKDVSILPYSKLDLVKFLIKKNRFKELLYDLIFIGICLRIYFIIGKLEDKFFTKT